METENNQPKTVAKADKLRWYVVASSSGKENKTAELIRQRIKANNYEEKVTDVIVPTQKKIVMKRGKKETVEERIYPGYILVRMSPDEETFYLVRNTEGVTGFVGTTAQSKHPTPLNPKEVEVILAFSQVEHAPVFDNKFQLGEAVKVSEGPFRDIVGTVREINETKGHITVLLSMFGQDVPVQLEFDKVSKISN